MVGRSDRRTIGRAIGLLAKPLPCYRIRFLTDDREKDKWPVPILRVIYFHEQGDCLATCEFAWSWNCLAQANRWLNLRGTSLGGKSMEALMSRINLSGAAILSYMFTFLLHLLHFHHICLHVLYICLHVLQIVLQVYMFFTCLLHFLYICLHVLNISLHALGFL